MAQVPDTSVTYTGTGAQTLFAFDVPYQEESDVFVEVDGVDTPFTFSTPSLVSVVPAPALGAEVVVLRSTDAYEAKYVFTAGVPFLLKFADKNWQQILYAMQEFQDFVNKFYTSVQKVLRTPENIPELPDAAARANTALLFDEDGNPALRPYQEITGSEVSGPVSSLDDQVALFSGITGKLIKAGQTMAQYLNTFLLSLYNIFPRTIANASLMSTIAPVVGQVVQLAEYHTGTGYGGGTFKAFSGVITPDNGYTFASATAGIYFKRIGNDYTTPLMYGARIGIDSLAVAQANTEAFRGACVSYKTAWEAFKLQGASRSVLVPAGDYNLSNGFTVPSGCVIYGEGVGAARIKVLNATADVSGKLPLISLQKVITTIGTLENTTGAYVVNPAPHVDNLYLNPQNTNTAVYIEGVPGFTLGRLWIQAQTAVDIGGGTSDGIIGELIVEDSTGVGLRLGVCQNIMLDKLYSYVTNFPIQVYGYAQNIDITNLQANYTVFSVLEVPAGIGCGRINIANFVCNQNVQYASFSGVIRAIGSFSDITVGHFDARNYNGPAAVLGQGNSLIIEKAVLRQAPNNPVYTIGTTAGGFDNSNGKLHIDNIDAVGIATAPFIVSGSSGLLDTQVNSGTVAGIGGATVVDIAASTTGAIVLQNIVNRTGKHLFNPISTIRCVWRNITSPFPIESLGGRAAMRIPFSDYGNSWTLNVVANTNPGGSSTYRRAIKLFVCQEGSYTGAPATVVSAILTATSIDPTYAPAITYQLDVDTLGSGASVAAVASGYVIVSFPGTYGNLAVSLESN